MDGGQLMIFDTASMYFRAFHGLPTSMRAPDGSPVNAVRGLLDAIARLVGQYSPDALACAWDDDWRPAWRVALVPSYKTHRLAAARVGADGVAEESPEELSGQVPVIREVLAALGIAVIGRAEHEADDVIGSLATQHGGESLVVTGDRDLFQLADARTRIIYIGKGVAKHDLVDPAWVRARYGVDADRYVDFATLRGDASDGLPGVKGVGDKSAASLVEGWGDLDAIIAAAEDPSSAMAKGLRAKILDAAGYLGPARTVVRVVRDLPLPELADGSLVRDRSRVDERRCAALAERWGLGSSMERILAALAA